MKSKNGILGKLIVRDSSALINPNTIVSITEVRPVNLSELEEKEKLELTFQYQYFIRSLIFPIQIVLRFVNKDCEKFLYRKRMADVEETKLVAENHLKLSIGDGDGILLPDGNEKITWKKTKGRVKVDYKGLSEQFDPSDELIQRFTSITEGHKMFLVPRKWKQGDK